MVSSGPRTSGAHFVYTELKRRILDLELEPGSRLYEPGLADELGVSRTPLREAIRRLISENLLQQQPTGGVVVPGLDATEIGELYEVRAALEALMARAAASAATEEDATRLQRLVERNRALVSFPDDAREIGSQLHAAIGELAGNGWAQRLHEQVTSQMQRYKAATNSTQERRETALADHQRIQAAIAAGDPDEAGRLAGEHVLQARDEALRLLTADPATAVPDSPR